MRALAFPVLLAALLVAGARAAPVVDVGPPPPTAPATVPADPAPSVFAGPGLLIARPSSVDAGELAALLRASGRPWVAVLVQDGQEALNGGVSAWAGPLRAAGVAVGGWGVLRTDPEADASLAAARVRDEGLAFYIADAEFEYSKLGDPGRSRRFVAAFRALAPALPAALSSFARVDGDYGYDWRAWRAAGFEYLPQCYLSDGDAFAPALAVRAALAVWPRSMIHPTVGVYGGVPASAYTSGLEEGFSVFPGETVDAAELATLLAAARR